MINEKQKWPTNKQQYDKNYLRVFGIVCPECNGDGIIGIGDFHDKDIICTVSECQKCNGLGYIEKKRK